MDLTVKLFEGMH